MGNFADCDRCNNNGWKRETGCPKCKRADLRPQRDAEYDKLIKQYEINARVRTREA